jgi:hypothetical protein
MYRASFVVLYYDQQMHNYFTNYRVWMSVCSERCVGRALGNGTSHDCAATSVGLEPVGSICTVKNIVGHAGNISVCLRNNCCPITQREVHHSSSHSAFNVLNILIILFQALLRLYAFWQVQFQECVIIICLYTLFLLIYSTH